MLVCLTWGYINGCTAFKCFFDLHDWWWHNSLLFNRPMRLLGNGSASFLWTFLYINMRYFISLHIAFIFYLKLCLMLAIRYRISSSDGIRKIFFCLFFCLGTSRTSFFDVMLFFINIQITCWLHASFCLIHCLKIIKFMSIFHCRPLLLIRWLWSLYVPTSRSFWTYLFVLWASYFLRRRFMSLLLFNWFCNWILNVLSSIFRTCTIWLGIQCRSYLYFS